MKIRGERECTECGTRWSYYETGSVGCPACGSIQSVGIDDRTEHTDLETPFDLTAIRNAIDEDPIEDIASRARDECQAYVRRRGFINAGRLESLDDDYLAATELLHVSDIVGRLREYELSDDEELYFLSLLRDADGGQRPPVSEVPRSLQSARGLAYANAVHEYRRDIRTWVDDQTAQQQRTRSRTEHQDQHQHQHQDDPSVLTSLERSTLEALGEHVTRIRMLDGDIEPRTAETLVDATRDLATGIRDDDDTAVAQAQNRLERLSFG
ncbi:DUF7117 family protein [Natronoglomus mannanivorans]|uniref:TFIIB-type zinc ribbon-containing protein n=1 Tax=Natronoglomus mannanivorans TaxID=2979990 RepID=A0AAP2YWV0_9EURY|nr:TFIIB-type zinc ribbon-containing protein [Halobacteria archaeon AArc-xg1-1]